MPTNEQGEPASDSAEARERKSRREKRDAAIGQRVMLTLGRPGRLHKVCVRRLWGDHYRVNVLTGVDEFSATIAHSYFVEADADGNIVRSTPEIVRQYQPAAGG